ncbi:MAG TPA: cation diffusion facilitator family transporter [Thermotogota bacterium]|nr:cation diffusion facilitator family transporter [Thermotogota bacterium]HRW92078.1 cation diffusion facilitator family transporter [Thermotogota bacterium]
MDSLRLKKIRQASWIGILGNGVLALLKLTVGLVSGSMAVVADGIDSTTDIVTSLLSLFTVRVMQKPPDLEHPYGHLRAETITTRVLAFIIFFAGIQVATTSFDQLFNPGQKQLPGLLPLLVTLLSVGGKTFLAIYKLSAGRKWKSPMLVADGKNMRNDILVSGGVFVGLFFTLVLKLPVLDAITSLVVSVWILKVAFGIFLESNTELMEGCDDPSLYRKIIEHVERIPDAHHPHRIRIRKMGTLFVIDLDVEVDGALCVSEGHEVARRVEKVLKESMENIYDVLVHIEPLGNKEEERFGLSEEDLAAADRHHEREVP